MKQYKFDIEYDKRYSYSWGYAMYSAFLEEQKDEISSEIHDTNSFTQYITPSEWIVNMKSDADYIFKESYHLHKFDTEIRLGNRKVIEISEQKMADDYLVNLPHRKNITLHFATPTTFKQNGEYVLYPTKDLIMQSLTNKWNSFADKFVIEDVVWDNCKISKYNLRSVNYALKGAKVQGFVGSVELFFWGSESMIRLGNMVCEFAKYSGVGIKATLGMGGTKIE